MNRDSDSLPVRRDGHNCFVCGPHNAIGLQVRFYMDGDVCRGEFTPGSDHCGYDGITHGGILFSLLDDVMANWLYLKGLRCFTAKCEIRYRNPVATGCRVLLVGRSLTGKRNVVVMEGVPSRADTSEVVADCQASFVMKS